MVFMAWGDALGLPQWEMRVRLALGLKLALIFRDVQMITVLFFELSNSKIDTDIMKMWVQVILRSMAKKAIAK